MALREAAVALLVGIGDVALLLGRGRWREARRLRWRFDCLTRLIDDLGWSGDGHATAITLSGSELSMVISWISRYSDEALAEQDEELRAVERERTRHDAIRGASAA
ncbi:hypothetical protein, partial [Pseudonocardia sp. DLS-67]